jgi:hypothetical protein
MLTIMTRPMQEENRFEGKISPLARQKVPKRLKTMVRSARDAAEDIRKAISHSTSSGNKLYMCQIEAAIFSLASAT